MMRLAGFLVVVAALAASAVSFAAEEGGVKFSKRCLMVNANEGCALADVNNDGKLDIVAGTHWYAAPDFVPRPVRDIPLTPDGEYMMSNGDQVFDVDGDGWVDVVSVGFFNPEICWFKNPGEAGLRRGLPWKRSILKVTRGENEAMDMRDLDGDGKPELFVNSWDPKAPVVAWKFTKGTDNVPTLERCLIGEQGSGHGYAIGDVNGDGRDDVLLEAGWYERPAADAWAKPWKFHPETALPKPCCPFLVVDVNGDGRNDLLWGKGHDYGIFWREQGEPKADGTTTWKEDREVDKSWSQPHYLAWADIDGDKQCELIAGKRARAHGEGDPGGKEPECLYYYHWDKQAGKFTRHTISEPGGGVGCGMQIRVADLNGDGKLDIAVAGKTGTYLLLNQGK